LQKPADPAAQPPVPAPRKDGRAADLQPPAANSGRGRLLDIVI